MELWPTAAAVAAFVCVFSLCCLVDFAVSKLRRPRPVLYPTGLLSLCKQGMYMDNFVKKRLPFLGPEGAAKRSLYPPAQYPYLYRMRWVADEAQDGDDGFAAAFGKVVVKRKVMFMGTRAVGPLGFNVREARIYDDIILDSEVGSLPPVQKEAE